MKKMIIASTAQVQKNSDYLSYMRDEIALHFQDIYKILFIPYARPGGITHDQYTDAINAKAAYLGKEFIGIHSFKDPIEAVHNAQAICVGGGNTFLLVSQLYAFNLLNPVKKAVLKGIPYVGTSAGANITGLTMQTTNDMPIVYPPSFNTLALIPFNINPHYLDPVKGNKHMGETRETRIKEFHKFNNTPVVGLREGSWLRVYGDQITLKGNLKARIFEQEKTAYEVDAGEVLNFQF